jgi:hypothetical protein
MKGARIWERGKLDGSCVGFRRREDLRRYGGSDGRFEGVGGSGRCVGREGVMGAIG